LHLGKVTSRDNGGGLVVDTDLETGGTPVNELDGALGLDGGNGSVDILGDDVSTVQQATGHVLSVTGVALDHLVGGLEARVGNLSDGELLVVGLLGRDDGGVGDQGEVDTGVGHQVGLEFGKIDVEGTVETERGSDRGDDLGNETVEVGVSGTFDVKVAAANVVDGFVVNHEGTVGVLKGGVGGQDRVVGLNDSGGNLGGGVDGELELGLLSVVDRETLKEEGTETGTSTTTERVEDEETLETSAVVSELTDTVKDKVNNFLSDGVVTTGVVVGGVFLAGNQLLGVEELTVGTSADFVNDSGLKVNEDGTGDVLAGTRLGEEGVERVVTSTDSLVRGHLTIRLDTVFQAVEFPAGVTNLDTGLTNVDRDTLTHCSLSRSYLKSRVDKLEGKKKKTKS